MNGGHIHAGVSPDQNLSRLTQICLAFRATPNTNGNDLQRWDQAAYVECVRTVLAAEQFAAILANDALIII